MKTFVRILMAVTVLASGGARVRAAEESVAAEPAKQWVWLERQGVWGYGYQITEGPHSGLWRIDPSSKQAPAAADPYGFSAVLNRIRARMGLAPAAYDPALSSWAAQNNAAQSSRGLGH